LAIFAAMPRLVAGERLGCSALARLASESRSAVLLFALNRVMKEIHCQIGDTDALERIADFHSPESRRRQLTERQS
jgi:hypothetical protein